MKVTDYGNEVLYGRQRIALNRFERREFTAKAPKQPTTETPGTIAGMVPANEMDKALFEKLRDVRKTLAIANHIAPYMVFSDKSLQAMATEKPTDQAEFSVIYGVGETKCQKYWRPFTAAIIDHQRSR